MLPEEHVRNVCKIGCGEKCCSFLMLDVDRGGFACAKDTQIETIILLRRITGEIKAKGDNCSGPPNYKPKNS